MIPSSACPPWQPEQAADAAQDSRSYTTSWGTIFAVGEGHEPRHVRDLVVFHVLFVDRDHVGWRGDIHLEPVHHLVGKAADLLHHDKLTLGDPTRELVLDLSLRGRPHICRSKDAADRVE